MSLRETYFGLSPYPPPLSEVNKKFHSKMDIMTSFVVIKILDLKE